MGNKITPSMVRTEREAFYRTFGWAQTEEAAMRIVEVCSKINSFNRAVELHEMKDDFQKTGFVALVGMGFLRVSMTEPWWFFVTDKFLNRLPLKTDGNETGL